MNDNLAIEYIHDDAATGSGFAPILAVLVTVVLALLANVCISA